MQLAYENSDYSVIEQAGMELNHSPAGLQLPGIDAKTRKEATRLCARDYLEHHVFFNYTQFHNHLIHHLLAAFTIGASAERLQVIYDINTPMQRPSIPPSSEVVITKDNYEQYLSQEEYYNNYVDFFRRELAASNGSWASVVSKYLFAPNTFPLALSGLFHPIIQVGYGIEFESEAIIATGLAQACVHEPMVKNPSFFDDLTNDSSSDSQGLSLMQIINNIRNDPQAEAVRSSTWPLSQDILTLSGDIALKHAKAWNVDANTESVNAKYHELLRVVAHIYGATSRPGYKPIFEFALMHCLTSAYFLPIIFTAIPAEQQAKLLKMYSRVVLGTFVSRGYPEFHLTDKLTAADTYSAVQEPSNASANPWFAVFEKAIASDDLHLAKVVRSLWRGSVIESFSSEPDVPEGYQLPPPINWLHIAKASVDTITASSFVDLKQQYAEGKRSWTFGIMGSDEFWTKHGERV